jgi:hypothetical protein
MLLRTNLAAWRNKTCKERFFVDFVAPARPGALELHTRDWGAKH